MKFLFLLTLLFANFAIAQRSQTIDADCLKIQSDGTCITKAKFNALDTLSTDLGLKADDSAVLHKSGDESASGVKTFSGQIVASSTTNGFRPCPVMTVGQRDAIASPANGDCVYNSTSSQLNVYSTAATAWKSAGGGLSPWLTATAYIVGDIVIESTKIYQCAIAHTSGTFATDLAASRWTLISSVAVNEATGVLALANGGTNKAITASNGALPYSDTDSFEMLSPGTTGQVLQTNGAGAPSWTNRYLPVAPQSTGAPVNTEEIQVPNSLLTQTATGKHLSETGNNNILANPSFEHSTFSTSWSISGCSWVVESTVVIHGKKSGKITCTAQTLSLTQDSTLYAAQYADGVQGVASSRGKSAISGFFVCSRQAGTTQLNNCAAITSDNKWNLYTAPYVLGATSNGIALVSGTMDSTGLVTVGNVTGDLYVDEATVSTTTGINSASIITPWASYTPTFTGFGTVTVSACRWRQNGSSIDIMCPFTTGTVSANEARVSLPNSYTISSTASGSFIAGRWVRNVTTTAGAGNILATSGQQYIKFAAADSSGSANYTTAVLGNAAFGSTEAEFFYATVPIAELSGSTQVFASQCGAGCENSLTASVTGSTGAIAAQRISGALSASRGATGTYTVTYSSLGLTVTPAIKITQLVGCAEYVVTVKSTTAVTFNTRTSANANADCDFDISIDKQGADYISSRTIVGSFKVPEDEVFVTGGNGNGSTNTRIRRFVTTVVSKPSAITYADSATLGGSFTVNVGGNYSITYCDASTSAGSYFGISRNSAQLTTNIQSITNADRVVSGITFSAGSGFTTCISTTSYFAAGDVIRAHNETTMNSTSDLSVTFRIKKVSL